MISSIYSMVKAAVVGQYQGPQGLATLSIAMSIWSILYSLGLLIGIGGFAIWWVMPITETLVAIYVGYYMTRCA